VRIAALRSLAALAPEVAAEILLISDDPHDRLAALQGLVRHHPTRSAVHRALLIVANDRGSDPYLRAVAVEQVARLDPSAAVDLVKGVEPEPHWQVRAARARVAASLGSSADAELLSLLRDPHPRVSAAALHAAIAAAGPDQLRKLRLVLLEQLHSDDPSVRSAAARGLGSLADPFALPFLLDTFERSLSSGHSAAALEALEALASLRLAGAGAPERALFARVTTVRDARVHSRGVELFGPAAVRAWGAPPAPAPLRSRADYVAMVEQWIAPPPGEATPPALRLRTGAGTLDLVLDAGHLPLETATLLSMLRRGELAGLEWTHVVPGSHVLASPGTGDSSEAVGYFTSEPWNAASGSLPRLGFRLTPVGAELVVAPADAPLSDRSVRVLGSVVRGEQALQRIMPGDTIISIQEVTEDTE
jgi:hypothetical protein